MSDHVASELRLGWRSRLRVAAGTIVTFALGVVAATPSAPWWVRLGAALAFTPGAAVCRAALVFASSWRMTRSALKMPSLGARSREGVGRDDLTGELADGPWPRVVVSGSKGRREERVNPLVSGVDLRRWWDSLPDG
ncbi:MAG: hypothetical protein ACO3D0_09835 [Ilumatobacteraceae bacterium]